MHNHLPEPFSAMGRGHRRHPTGSSTIASKDNRWSDVVPPNSALTFAVLWDPEDDIVAFSGADLLDGLLNNDDDEGGTHPDSPTDAWDSDSDSDSDSYSQVLTIGHSTLPLSEHTTTATATLAFFREHHDFLFSTTQETPLTFRFGRTGRQTQTSSTLEGLDVYLRGSMFARTHVRDRKYSFLGELLADDFEFDPRTSFANVWMQKGATTSGKYQSSVSDEGYAEGTFGPGFNGLSREDGFNLRSAFSVTTTSTSNYISVELDEFADDEDSSWSTLEAPNTPGFSRLLFSQQQQRRSSGRLKKRRPQTGIDGPAPPLEVLQRPCYNHTTTSTAAASTARSTSCTSKHIALPRFVRSLSLKRWRPAASNKELVCTSIDVDVA